MNKKIRLNAAALLCAMMVTGSNVYSTEYADFDTLKQAVDDGGEVQAELNQPEYEFTDGLDIQALSNVDITGQSSETTTLKPNESFKDFAFNVQEEGTLSLKNLTLSHFGNPSAVSGNGVIDNKGTLNIGPDVIFDESAKASGYVWGGIIENEKNLNITTDETGDVTFNKLVDAVTKKAFDIEMNNNSQLNIEGTKGTVTFTNGITSRNHTTNSSIIHDGDNEVVLGGSNNSYFGTFTNEKGKVTVNSGASFFGGNSTFNGGSLDWNTNENLSGTLKLNKDVDLTVGNGSGGALTISGNSSIDNARTITVNDNGKLTLSKNTTFNNTTNSTTVKGSGNLTLNSSSLTLIGQVINDENLKFTSTNGTVNLQSVEQGGKELKVLLGESANNSNLTLNLKNYTGGTESVNVAVDGSKLKALNFEEGTNSHNGDITISESGVVTNKANAKTTVSGDVTIDATGEALVNGNSATLTIEGSKGLTNKGNINNGGTLSAKSVTNEGTISGSGSLNVTEGNLTNGTADKKGTISAGSIDVTGNIINNNTESTITATTGAITTENITNDGTITAGTNITATGAVTNNKSITATGKLDVDGKLTNADSATVTMGSGELADVANSGTITSNGTLSATNVSNGTASSSITGTSLTLEDITSNEGTITATTGDITANNVTNTGTITATNGAITATGTVTNNKSISAKGKFKATGKLTNADSATVTMGSGELAEVDNSGTITSNGTLSATNVSNGTASSSISGTSLTLGDITSNAGTITATTGAITANDITNNGTITATNGAITANNITNSETITAGTNITANGTVTNNKSITATSGKLKATGKLTNGADATVKAASGEFADVDNSGKIAVNDNITATGAVDNKTKEAAISGTSLTFNSTLTNSGTVKSTGTTTVTGDLVNNAEAGIEIGGGTLNKVTNNGTITNNNGTLNLADEFSGTGNFNLKNGTLNVNESASGFTGAFTQTGGTANVADSANIFGGNKNISNGTFNVNSGAVNYTGVKLGDNAKFNHTGEGGTITDDVITFTGSNAQAKFKGKDTKADFTLDSGITGTSNNSISFDNSTLKFSGENTNFNYKNFTIKDTVLNLLEKEDIQDKVKTYNFSNFVSDGNNNSVDFNVHIKNDGDGAYAATDVLKFTGSSKGSLKMGNIYVTGEDKAETGFNVETKENQGLIQGSGVTLSSDIPSIEYGTSRFVYDVKISSDNKGVEMDVKKAADNNTLYDMNNSDRSERQFYVSEDYTIGKSLNDDGAHTKAGKFSVFGKADSRERVLDAHGASLFSVEGSDKVDFTLKDLTVQNAKGDASSKGVVYGNSSENASALLDNLYIKDNSASSLYGGAVYNNGGKGTDPATKEFTGLKVVDTLFENNTTTGGLGGAIYNDTNGYMYLKNVTTKEGEELNGDNDIYNNGIAELEGRNTFESLFTNDTNGEVTFAGEGTDLADFANNGKADFEMAENNIGNLINDGELNVNLDSAVNISGDVTGDKGSINAAGTLVLESTADASEYTGTFTQSTDGSGLYSYGTTVESGAKFFGGKSNIDGGILNWYTQEDLAEDAVLTVTGKGTYLNVGQSDNPYVPQETGKLSLTNGSSIAKEVNVVVSEGSEINVKDGELTLNENDTWEGTISLSDENGVLNISDVDAFDSSVLKAEKGELNILEDANIYIGNGSSIADETAVNLEGNVLLENSSLTIGKDDTWAEEGVLALSDNAVFTYEGTSDDDNGILYAEKGTVNVTNGSTLYVGGTVEITDEGEKYTISGTIKGDVQTNIEDGSAINITDDGTVDIDNSDNWKGAIVLDGGTLNYGTNKKTGLLEANTGNLNLLEGSELTIKEPSAVQDVVNVDIQKGSTVNIEEGAQFNLDSKDKWHGLIKNENGIFTTDGIDNTKAEGSGLRQTGGKSTFKNKSNIMISDSNSFIQGGEVNLETNSTLAFGSGVKDLNVHNLNISGNSTLGMMNKELHDTNVGDVKVNDNANFTIDLNPRERKGDKFIINNLTTDKSGNVNISDFDFTGGAPIDRYIKFQIFDAKSIDDKVTFGASNKQIFTPIGWYGLESLGGGSYQAKLGRYNPQVFRGQAATLAAYNQQLFVDDMITNHFVLHGERMVDSAKNANKYSASAVFTPYQQTYQDGGLWAKTYVSMNKLDMTHDLAVRGTMWGTLVGADLPAVELNNKWKFIPTGYAAYSAGHQHFNGVSMQQNGGQLGVMGTFIRNNDFITSITAYGGGYTNDMDVAGYSDDTANWFAGSAIKTAYNIHAGKSFVFQPNLFLSYNAFGRQNWGTDFGVMSMSSAMLQGANVAPGFNLILNKKTWSLYGTFQYMYYINDKVNGDAGNVHLPYVRMDHGYMQYGVGATKTIKDRLNTYGQITLRNVGVNGIGFQFGINYLCDIKGFKKKTSNTASNKNNSDVYVKKIYVNNTKKAN